MSLDGIVEPENYKDVISLLWEALVKFKNSKMNIILVKAIPIAAISKKIILLAEGNSMFFLVNE